MGRRFVYLKYSSTIKLEKETPNCWERSGEARVFELGKSTSLTKLSPKYLKEYELVIGLEVHTQLLTQSKAFSPEPALFGSSPNTYVDSISLAHPGTLPILNEKLPKMAVRLGLALDCKIRPVSYLARKHYFYPDLPKGYQISQYEDPICFDGKLEISVEDGADTYSKTIGITRIHMEEDAGKSIHDLDPSSSMIDLNRCGVPLLEIVSEPELSHPSEAVAYLKKIHALVQYLDLCDGNMEEGSFRCDANISVRPIGETKLGTKAEIKNMNSFRHVEAALVHEFNRQAEVLSQGGEIIQETRLWDPDGEVTKSMRGKERAHDYRYFPDPDLLRVEVDDKQIEEIAESMPELPDARLGRLVEEGLSEYDAGILVGSKSLADYFDTTMTFLDGLSSQQSAKVLANLLMTEVLRLQSEGQYEIDELPISAERLAGLIDLRQADKVNSSAFVELFNEMLKDERDASTIAQEKNLIQVSDTSALSPIILSVIESSPKQVEQYKSGKTGVIGYFIGLVMRQFDGSPDPKVVKGLLEERLNEL